MCGAMDTVRGMMGLQSPIGSDAVIAKNNPVVFFFFFFI